MNPTRHQYGELPLYGPPTAYLLLHTAHLSLSIAIATLGVEAKLTRAIAIRARLRRPPPPK